MKATITHPKNILLFMLVVSFSFLLYANVGSNAGLIKREYSNFEAMQYQSHDAKTQAGISMEIPKKSISYLRFKTFITD